MPDRDQGLPRLAFAAGVVESLAIERLDASRIGVGGPFHPGHIAGAKERHGDAPCRHCAIAILHRQNQTLKVDVIAIAQGLSDHAGIEQGKERRWCLQSPGRVMISRCDDDLEMGNAAARFGQKDIELGLRSSGWVGVVEHIARDQQSVDLFGHQRVEQPGQEKLVLMTALELVQRLAQVPVRGVKKSHVSPLKTICLPICDRRDQRGPLPIIGMNSCATTARRTRFPQLCRSAAFSFAGELNRCLNWQLCGIDSEGRPGLRPSRCLAEFSI